MATTLKAAKDKVLTVALINNIIQDSPRDPGAALVEINVATPV